MVLEIKRLLSKGEYKGNISYEFTPDKSVLLVPLCSFEGAVGFNGEYEIFDGDEVELEFEITYRLKGQCSYCLKQADRAVKFSSKVLFVTDKDDLDNYYYDGVRLDLSKAVSDALLFSQPNVLLCEDCANAK